MTPLLGQAPRDLPPRHPCHLRCKHSEPSASFLERVKAPLTPTLTGLRTAKCQGPRFPLEVTSAGAYSCTVTSTSEPAGLCLYRNPSPLMSRCISSQLLDEETMSSRTRCQVQRPWSSASDPPSN